MRSFNQKFINFIQKVNTVPEDPKKYVLTTYSVLRWAMGGLGLILPPLLVIGGLASLWWISTPLEVQNSLSAYYHAGSDELGCAAFRGVYRDLFVGPLTAISACLIIYRGFTVLENWLLNFAGVFLMGVAFFPTSWPESQLNGFCCGKIKDFQSFEAAQLMNLPISIHAASAILFFVVITMVNVFTAMATVHCIKDAHQKKVWKKIFEWARFLMPASIGVVLLIRLFTGTSIIGDRLILWLEWAGIWAFSIYWILKSVEILMTHDEENWFNSMQNKP